MTGWVVLVLALYGGDLVAVSLLPLVGLSYWIHRGRNATSPGRQCLTYVGLVLAADVMVIPGLKGITNVVAIEILDTYDVWWHTYGPFTMLESGANGFLTSLVVSHAVAFSDRPALPVRASDPSVGSNGNESCPARRILELGSADVAVRLSCPRYWMAMDVSIFLYVDEEEPVVIGSIKQGVDHAIGLDVGDHDLKLSFGKFRSRTYSVRVPNPGIYEMSFAYSRFWGNFIKEFRMTQTHLPPPAVTP